MLFLRFWKSIWESWSWFRSCGIWCLSVRSMFIFIVNLLLIFWEVVFRWCWVRLKIIDEFIGLLIFFFLMCFLDICVRVLVWKWRRISVGRRWRCFLICIGLVSWWIIILRFIGSLMVVLVFIILFCICIVVFLLGSLFCWW